MVIPNPFARNSSRYFLENVPKEVKDRVIKLNKARREWARQDGGLGMTTLDVAKERMVETFNQPPSQRINAAAVRTARDKLYRDNIDNVLDKEKYLQANLLQIRNKDSLAKVYYNKDADMIMGTPRVNDYMDLPMIGISDTDDSPAARYVRHKPYNLFPSYDY